MTRPRRITLSRAPGWRMPAGAVKCDRSTPLGNPWAAGPEGRFFPAWRARAVQMGRPLSVRAAVELHRLWLIGAFGCAGGTRAVHPEFGEIVTPHGHAETLARIAGLRGADLACWCHAQAHGAEMVWCHVDTLLVLANADHDGGYAAWRAAARAAALAAIAGRELPGSPGPTFAPVDPLNTPARAA